MAREWVAWAEVGPCSVGPRVFLFLLVSALGLVRPLVWSLNWMPPSILDRLVDFFSWGKFERPKLRGGLFLAIPHNEIHGHQSYRSRIASLFFSIVAG